MNDVRCPRCGAAAPENAPFCGNCGTPLALQPPVNNQFQGPTSYYPPPVVGPKVMGDNTKWALGLGIAAVFCCGPVTGIIGLFLAKKDMDEIAAGRAPQLDGNWAKWAFYLNIAGLILFVAGLCMFWGMSGLRSF